MIIDKTQAYPTPENVKEVQAFVRILGFWGTFTPQLAQCIHPFPLPGVRRVHVGLGIRGTSLLRKGRILVKANQNSGISKVGILFELNISVSPEGIWALIAETAGESTIGIFVPFLEKGRNMISTP